MGKYTFGSYITALSVGFIVFSLTAQYMLAIASTTLAIGLAYITTGLFETYFRVQKALKELK